MVTARCRNPDVPRRTVRVAGCPVQTTVTARLAIVRRWLYTTLWLQRRRLHSSSGLTAGLGVQWTPPFGRRLPAGAEPRPDTLQLCVGNRCLIFQLARAASGAVPQILRRFLADARVTFAACNVESDRRKLRAHHGLQVRSALELRAAAPRGMGNASMATVAERLLGMRGLEKPGKVGASRWDAPRLSRKQVRYAAADAYVSCRLGVHFRRRAAMASDDQESEPEYYSDEDVRCTARDEVSPEPEYEHGDCWGRFVGFLERVSDDDDPHGEAAVVDDHVYDSMCSSLVY
ncbi:hypothetical protein PAHAL_2G006700 [Panicum hallii]|uniref:3'-5' exonuclease domain-containing protein n=1 Tax=Panicum hallii TaxID=206008 RepID=A0A2S3GV70_9POAL|nr:exonuclease 3'-5' domain-containing protein 2-like [Panicum hallii]PAN09294.1 hypothetical protein PAHAL_2G006700 [Panicum hallii]